MSRPTPGLLTPDYEIGYGKPPKATQFKPGQSGNKRGRPKGSRNFSTDLKEILASKTVVTLNGKPKKISTQKATLERLRQKALQGDARALDKIITLAQQLGEAEEQQSTARNLIKEDAEILERFALNASDTHQDSAP